MNTKTYRASSANLFWVCPAASHPEPGEILVNPVDEAGTMGSAVHEACASLVLGRETQIDRITQEYGFDADQKRELEILTAIANKFWQEYGPLFGDPHVEQGFRAVADAQTILTGHIDVLGEKDGVVRVLDWKTTRLQTVSYAQQMKQYLWLVANSPETPFGEGFTPHGFQYVICFLRDKTIEVSPIFKAEELDHWCDEYVDRLAGWDRSTYCPGGHCGYCPRSISCPALERRLALTVRSLKAADGVALADKIDALTNDECVDTYEGIRAAEKVLADAVKLIYLRAQHENNTLAGCGKALVLRQDKWEVIEDAKAAWPVLAEHFTDEEIAGLVEISKKQAMDLVAAKTEKGKGKAKSAFMDELRAAGALGWASRIMPRIVATEPVETQAEIECEEVAP